MNSTNTDKSAQTFEEWFSMPLKRGESVVFHSSDPMDQMKAAWTAAKASSAAELLTLRARLEKSEASCVEKDNLLREVHNHLSDGPVVFFEQDGKPIGMETDLGEAYQESAMCEKVVRALSIELGEAYLCPKCKMNFSRKKQPCSSCEQAQILATLAAAEEMEKLFFHIEWSSWTARAGIRKVGACPICINLKNEGHRPDCTLKSALTKFQNARGK